MQLIIYALKENFNANFNEYNIEDVSNFDEEFTDKEVAHSALPESKLNMVNKNKEKFDDFDK